MNTFLDCEHLLSILGSCKWAINVEHVLRDMIETSQNYISDHFASLIASDSFLSLGHGNSWNISRLEHLLLRTASTLTPDQACKSYQRCTRLNTVLGAKVITVPNGEHSQEKSQHEEMDWNEEFVRLVSAIVSAVEQCLTRQCARAMKVGSWLRMDAELRKKIQKLACLTDPIIDRKSRAVNKYNFANQPPGQLSRNHDIHQVRLAIHAQSRRSISNDNKQYRASTHTQTNNIDRFMQTLQATTDKSCQANRESVKENARASLGSDRIMKTTSRTHVPETTTRARYLTHVRSQSEKIDVKSMKEKPLTSTVKLSEVKPRYLEPKKDHNLIKVKSTSHIPNNGKHGGKRMSSSESSTRTSSPAAPKKLVNKSGTAATKKKITESNISLDSLASPAKTTKNPKQNSELSVDSLQSSIKTDRTISHECLVPPGGSDNGKKLLDDNKVMNSKNISKSNPMINKENNNRSSIPSGNKLSKSKSISYHSTSGNSPATNLANRTINSGGSTTTNYSPRAGYKGRIGTVSATSKIPTEGSPLVKRSFLSAKSKEILMKKNQGKSTGIPIIKSNSSSPILLDKKNLNKSAQSTTTTTTTTTNVPHYQRRTISQQQAVNVTVATLNLRKSASGRCIPSVVTKTKQSVIRNGNIGGGVIAEKKKEKICVDLVVVANQKTHQQEIEPSQSEFEEENDDVDDEKVMIESRMQRSSTFCKETSDLPTNELQIIE